MTIKIGLIVECERDGADQRVCEHLVSRLRPNSDVITVTMGGKPNLINGCGDVAAQLLRESCERVIVVWDLYPPWRRGNAPCRRDDRLLVYQSLEQAGVSSPPVEIVCIREELEAWLVADNRAISMAIQKLIGRRVRINEMKDPERVKNPKVRLRKIFAEHTHRQYQEHIDALRIIRELPDLKRIRRAQSFVRFASKIS